MCSGLAEQYAGTNVSLSLPSTRVDAFNIDLAQELSRNGRRTGLTFAPEGGSERIRKVINKMVTEEDLIRTVVTAYSNGWRQVKLYFMCGLPTETDDDVVQIARMAHEVIKAGRAATGSKDIRCTVSIGGFVPKPHTPFQWASMASPETIDRRLKLLRDAINSDRGARPGDRLPLPRRRAVADRRPAVPRRPPGRRGHPQGVGARAAVRRLVRALLLPALGATRPPTVLPAFGVDLDWFTTRERDELEVLPWDHLDSGLDKDWLWKDWQDSVSEFEQDDCRWTPCFDCGVCPSHGHRDPDRPDRPEAAAADAGEHRPARAGLTFAGRGARLRAPHLGEESAGPGDQVRDPLLDAEPGIRGQRRGRFGDPDVGRAREVGTDIGADGVSRCARPVRPGAR